MYDFMREYEIKQHRINASNGADSIGKLRKIVNGDGNFDIYIDRNGKFCTSVAKPGSGCKDSIYGDLSYIKYQIKRGIIDPHSLTKYGRRLLESIKR